MRIGVLHTRGMPQARAATSMASSRAASDLVPWKRIPKVGFGKRGLLEKGSPNLRFLAFLAPCFPKDFRGSAAKEILAFWVAFLAVFQKGMEKKIRAFQKSRFSRESRQFRESGDSREARDCGKQRRIRPISRDSRASSNEKTPFVMTPSSGRDKASVEANNSRSSVHRGHSDTAANANANSDEPRDVGGVLRGNTIRGSRPERF